MGRGELAKEVPEALQEWRAGFGGSQQGWFLLSGSAEGRPGMSQEKIEWIAANDTVCRVCSNPVDYRIKESSDEAYQDIQYRCPKCGYSWWIDGSDY